MASASVLRRPDDRDGPELAYDEVPGLGPQGLTQSICRIDHAQAAKSIFETLVAHRGPAYEFLFILETALRRAKVWGRVPKTGFMTEHGHGDRTQHRAWQGAGQRGELEPGLPGRLRRRGHRLCRAAAESAAQRQLVVERQMGPPRQGGFEKHFLRKLRKGRPEPFCESLALKVPGTGKLKETTKG